MKPSFSSETSQILFNKFINDTQNWVVTHTESPKGRIKSAYYNPHAEFHLLCYVEQEPNKDFTENWQNKFHGFHSLGTKRIELKYNYTTLGYVILIDIEGKWLIPIPKYNNPDLIYDVKNNENAIAYISSSSLEFKVSAILYRSGDAPYENFMGYDFPVLGSYLNGLEEFLLHSKSEFLIEIRN